MTVTISQKSGKGTSHGVVSELSAFFTVRPGHEEAIREALDRFQTMIHNLTEDVHQKVGLREWRQVLFDGGKRMMLITAFETDWDPYMDDALTIIGIDNYIDVLQRTVEAAMSFKEVEGAIKSVRSGEANGAALNALKALVQSAQSPANVYFDRLSAHTVPELQKAQRVEQAFEQVLDDPAAEQALQQPALR